MRGDLKGLFHEQIRTLFAVGTASGLTDGQLLERFATRRDEGAELAFSVLVERHGPMVLRACRGILRDDHEAMDAFQATFLVLARRGGSLWVRDSLGPWLHRVACHAAGRARSTAARRRAIEREAVEMAEARDAGEDREELAAVIHEEVDRLPERYRSAVVLCDLEGRTCEEAARHLGCPVGTVGSRLARGRQRLRDRLSRRGLAPRGAPASGIGIGLDIVLVASQGMREPISQELVGATAGAAARFVSSQAIPQGTAALLAQGVLRSMAMTRWWKVASVLLAVSASTSGVVAFVGKNPAVAEARTDETLKPPPAEGIAVTGIQPGTLRVVVEERGVLQASRDPGVFCTVEGQVTIGFIVPEDTRVTRGQLVCELDSSSLREQLASQVAAVKKAEAALETARLTREVAEIAVREYVEGIYPRDSRALLSEIALARSSITRAEERLKRTQAARERWNAMLVGQGGTKTSADIVAGLDIEDRLAAAEEALGQGRRAIEIGQARREVLENFTRDRTIKRLQIEVDTHRPAELAQQAAWELERSREAKLRRQIDNCRILAPADGVMVYANGPSRFLARPQPQIEEGAAVRERQKIFSVRDVDGPMRVEAKIPEAIVDRLSPGLTAQVQVEAFPDEVFLGVVEDVAPLPDPASFANPGIKVYTTHVALTNRIAGLRPGMTARVEILVARRDDVLIVPVRAVVSYDNTDHVAVKTAGGGVDWREVTLGLSSDTQVEVKEGLKIGDTVAVDPAPLLSEEQKRKMALPSPGPKPKPKPKSKPK